MKIRQNNDVIDCIGVVYVENKTELCEQSDWVWYVIKTSKDNDITSCTGLVYAKIKSKLLKPIEQSEVYYKDQTC